MRKLKFKLDRKALETFYLVFIRPILEYGDVIWDNCTQYEKNELDKIQNEARRIAIGGTKLISLNALYKETNWKTLSQRRDNHKATLFYKMMNQLTPNYLSSLVFRPVGATSRYNLRNSNSLQTIDARTNQYFHSFLPSTEGAWNNLPNDVMRCSSVNSFKYNIKQEKIKAPKHFTLAVGRHRFYTQDYVPTAVYSILTYFIKNLSNLFYVTAAVLNIGIFLFPLQNLPPAAHRAP